jgi:iron complex outermembrane receptor protein
MSRCACLFAAVLLLVCPATGPAASSEPPTPEHTEEIEVRDTPVSPDAEQIGEASLARAMDTNVALLLDALPGVSGVRRSHGALEPVVRGLGWERVPTRIDGVPLHGACPARMDPPACYVAPSDARQVVVTKGLASVTLGPAGTGGGVDVVLDAGAARPSKTGVDLHTRLAYDQARRGPVAHISGNWSTRRFHLRGSAHRSELENYDTAEGREIPAAETATSGHISAAYDLASDHTLSGTAFVSRHDDVDYPALPMNSVFADTDVLRVAYRGFFDRGPLVALELSAGTGQVDHLMDNARKPSFARVAASTSSDARTDSARATTTWRLGPTTTLEAGADGTWLVREAVRTRTMQRTGTSSRDLLWPDAVQDTIGAFAELDRRGADGWSLRAGARVDTVDSDARAADGPSLGGRTIREQYARFYGDAAADIDRRETLVSANVLAERRVRTGSSVYGGVGVTSRAASVTERFFAFAAAPGGYQVGDPSLEAEVKRELVVGARLAGRVARARVALHYSDFADYVLSTTLGFEDVDGDATADRIRGFRNVDATIWGAEASIVVDAAPNLRVPLSVEYVRAEDDASGTPLPEIPPLQGSAALRWIFGGSASGHLELGVRAAAKQDRIDPRFGEDATPAYEAWHLRGSLDVGGGFALDLGVENLFDETYHDHLTREAFLPVADLAAGDEIPEPGRHVRVALRWSL